MPNTTLRTIADKHRRLARLLTTAALVIGAWPAAAAEDLNRIVLRVNEEILTLHDYEVRKANEISSILANPQLSAEESKELLAKVGRVTMQNSFSELLLVSFARQQGIRVTDAEVEDAIRQLKERQGITTEEEFLQALTASGLNPESLREGVHRDLLWQQVVGREVNPRVQMDEEEVRAYYRNHREDFRIPEERWLKEVIVLEASGLGEAELARTAEEVRAALAAGDDFEAVVEPYREKGVSTGVIDLEWLQADELEPALSEAAWALAAGELSPPVAARGGYHILHVVEVRESRLRPLAEVQDAIARREYNARFARELRTFMTELEQASYIQEDLPPEAVGYRALAAEFQAEDELERFRAPTLEPEEPDSDADPASAPGSGADAGR